MGGACGTCGRQESSTLGFDDIKMGLQEVGWKVMDWIDLAQDRDRLRALVNVAMKHRVP
jgi:hypothetical protein